MHLLLLDMKITPKHLESVLPLAITLKLLYTRHMPSVAQSSLYVLKMSIFYKRDQ